VFASGLFIRFDRTFVVCEPTRKAVVVHRQYRDSAEFDVALSVVGNKVTDAADVDFLRHEIGGDLLDCFAPRTRQLPSGGCAHLDYGSAQAAGTDLVDVATVRLTAAGRCRTTSVYRCVAGRPAFEL
jgi:hypothetical protein